MNTATIYERFPRCLDPALKWVPGRPDTLHIGSNLMFLSEGEKVVCGFADVWDFCDYVGNCSPDTELTDEEWLAMLMYLAS